MKRESSPSETADWVRRKISVTNGISCVVELPKEKRPQHATDDWPRVIAIMGTTEKNELGYMFNSMTWGQGYATESLAAFVPLYWQYALGRPEYLIASIDEENIGSRKVLEKVGFKKFEILEDDFESPVLGTRDSIVYRLARQRTRTWAELFKVCLQWRIF
jgi:RimJ/RimL family protein N-acetyltransferase